LFTTDDVLGAYPTIAYETGFGISAGARLVHRDLAGRGERLQLRADVGTSSRQAYGLAVRSGERIPGVALEIDASYERRPDEPFYGVGDDALGIETRYRDHIVRAAGTIDVPLVDALSLRFDGAIVGHDLAGASVDNARVEGQVVYDSRRPASIYASPVIDATGWFASVYAGVARGLGSDATHFTSYGGEVQRYFDLYAGTRVLALRLLVEAIDDGDVSFVDLPQLGGTELLRGYPRGRFRDRALTLATAEYSWELGNFLAAYLFVDAGRVWPSLRDFELADPRIGYGGGIQLHTSSSYIARVQLAGSRDGDFVLELVLSPAFPRRERVGRF
jgi:outer membrane protein assembly factor BamA